MTPPTLVLRDITLRVGDLARSREFYVGRLGFHVARETASTLELGVAPRAPAILRLEAAPGAGAAPREAAGLFHAALLFPTRAALGGWLQHAVRRQVEFDGASDHGVSEALYLADPDGNGLEFYADRPASTWPRSNGSIAMVTEPLDLASLLAAGVPSAVPLAGAAWGHLHLRVTNLDRSERFYADALGLAVTQRDYPGARFMAADGYHHHLGLNVWGHPQQPQPTDAVGLANVTFALRAAPDVRPLRAPDHIAITIAPLGA